MFSISLESFEVKEFEEEYKKFVVAVNDFAEDIFSDPCLSLAEAEFRVLEASRSWGQKFLEMFISQRAGEQACEPVDVLSVNKRVVRGVQGCGVLRRCVVLSV